MLRRIQGSRPLLTVLESLTIKAMDDGHGPPPPAVDVCLYIPCVSESCLQVPALYLNAGACVQSLGWAKPQQQQEVPRKATLPRPCTSSPSGAGTPSLTLIHALRPVHIPVCM